MQSREKSLKDSFREFKEKNSSLRNSSFEHTNPLQENSSSQDSMDKYFSKDPGSEKKSMRGPSEHSPVPREPRPVESLVLKIDSLYRLKDSLSVAGTGSI